MTTYVIERNGQRDLQFDGTLLASANDRRAAGREKTRWRELTLYKLKNGSYILQTEHLTLWQGELGTSSAAVCNDALEVVEALEQADGGLSELAKELLMEAAKADAAFDKIWVERLE